jgi:hypothetical protein
VPQPQRHLTDVLRCLQDDHRACVPEDVGRDAFLVEAGMRSSGGRCMLFKALVHGYRRGGILRGVGQMFTVAITGVCCAVQV